MTTDLQIIETQDGSHSVFSPTFGVSYHSRYGAIQESRHVFIEAGLHRKMLTQKDIRILEIGFGTGLNAFLTLLETEVHPVRIYYETVEAFPLTEAQAALLNYPDRLERADKKELFLELHRSPWEEIQQLTERFQFKKVNKRFEELAYDPSFDLIYFDAFAPNAQPDLWEMPLLGKMYEALRPDGVIVTYCAKGSVKRAMKGLGFSLEALPGPPGKREMTRGQKKG